MKKNMKYIIFAIIAVLVVIVLINFNNMRKTNLKIMINSDIVELGDNKEIDLVTFSNEKDIIIEKVSDKATISINGEIVNKSLNLGKLEINKESKIVIDVLYNNGKKDQYIINTLPSTFPDYVVEGESEYEGDYYLSTYSFEYDAIHYILKLDKQGKIKFYKKTNMVAFDFKKVKNKQDEIRYTFLEATANNFKELTSLLPCDLVILDENYNEIDRVKFVKDDVKLSLDNHTYIYLDDGHYILTAYEAREKDLYGKKSYVLDCLIQEIKDGKEIWRFDSGNYSELYSFSTVNGLDYTKPYQDYIHINSMEIDEKDGNLLCSFRNIDSLIKIDRTNGEIIWKLSGKGDEFGLTENQKTSKQHCATFDKDGAIMLYDNGNANERSRILKIELDEENKKVKSYKEYDTGLYAFMMGSIQEIDNDTETYLVCYGGGNYGKYSVEEINYSTKKVEFKFTFVENNMLYNINKIK